MKLLLENLIEMSYNGISFFYPYVKKGTSNQTR